MDAPDKDQLDQSDPKTLATELMADKWTDSTTQKFKVLDTYKKAEELKKELLADNLDILFQLATIKVSDEKEKFESTKTNYYNAPSITITNTPELSLYKHSNPIKCVSVNNNGQFVAADSANKHFVRKPDRSIYFFATSGPQIKMVRMHEIENMVSSASKWHIKIFHAITDEIDSSTLFNDTKKIFFTSDGSWSLFKNYSNGIFLTHNASQRTWDLRNRDIENPTCLAFEENNCNGLIGTSDDLFCVTIADDKCQSRRVNTKRPIPNIDCVDVTPDGRFGLATNYQGFCRISLREKDYPRIGKFDDGITAARISSCGQLIITGYRDGSIIFYKVINNEIHMQSRLGNLLETNKITSLALSPDNKTLAAGSQNGLVVASCKNTYIELEKLSPAQLAAFLRLGLFGVAQLDNPLIKQKFVTLQTPTKYEYLKAKKIAEDEKHGEDFLCPICSEKIINTSTSCNHGFCDSCLQSWQAQNATCPTCRAPLPQPKANP